MSDVIMAGNIPCHVREDLDSEFTDEQLVSHLIHSNCSECRDAGSRLKALVEKKSPAPVVKFAVELVKRIDYEGDWVEFVGQFDSYEEAIQIATNSSQIKDVIENEGYGLRITVTGIEHQHEPQYGHTWFSPQARYQPRPESSK